MFNFFTKNKQPHKLFFETDMHCHLIPGIDDGQKTSQGAVLLVEKEIEWGIKRIFCTPHITQDKFENTPEIISTAFILLQNEVKARNLDVFLDYSAEHRLDAFFRAELERGAIKSLPNGHLLVENSFVQEAWELDNLLFDLNLRGYRPILAHPERYSYYFNHPERYKQLHNAGTKFQVNLLSLAGYYGKDIKQIAENLIENNLVDYIGTDMHHSAHADAIDRYLCSKEYLKIARILEPRILNDKEI